MSLIMKVFLRKEKKRPKDKNRFALYLAFLFIVFLFIVLLAEYKNDSVLIWMSKPFLVPILIIYYITSVKKVQKEFLFVLVFNWIALLLSINNEEINLHYLSLLFEIISWVIILVFLFNNARIPKLSLLLYRIVPFAMLYLLFVYFYEGPFFLDNYLYFFYSVILMIVGGVSLAKYISSKGITNSFFLSAVLFFVISNYMFLFKINVENSIFFQITETLSEMMGVLLLVNYMIFFEKAKKSIKLDSSKLD